MRWTKEDVGAESFAISEMPSLFTSAAYSRLCTVERRAERRCCDRRLATGT